jgi:hypothetical protein
MLARLEQLLGQRSAGATAALDLPQALRPGPGIGASPCGRPGRCRTDQSLVGDTGFESALGFVVNCRRVCEYAL